LQLSWFGGEKFCRSGGWMLGAVTSESFQKEVMRQWKSKLGWNLFRFFKLRSEYTHFTLQGDSDLWSGVNKFSDKATFASSETGQIIKGLNIEKGSLEKGCLLYSEFVLILNTYINKQIEPFENDNRWKSGTAIAKLESCSKKAKFFCQLPPSCPMDFETCIKTQPNPVYNEEKCVRTKNK